jgi:hypothetical protein
MDEFYHQGLSAPLYEKTDGGWSMSCRKLGALCRVVPGKKLWRFHRRLDNVVGNAGGSKLHCHTATTDNAIQKQDLNVYIYTERPRPSVLSVMVPGRIHEQLR